MKHCALFIFCALCLVAVSGGSEAQQQEAVTPADSSVYRVSSAKLRWTIEDGERVVYLEGGVRIDHETTTITSLRGRHYPNRRYIVLHDSVRVVDGSAEMTGDVGEYFGETNTVGLDGHVRFNERGWKVRCDRATYNRRTRLARFTGNLSIADSTRTMYADTVVYNRDREIADATGSVVIVDDVDDYSIAGKHIRFDRLGKTAVVDANPILTFDLKSDEKGTVVSRVMRFDVDRKIGVAEGDVQIVKGETRASCDSATIYDTEGRAVLTGNPKAMNGSSSMTGTRMLLWYNDNEVERIELPDTGRLAEAPKAESPWKEDSWIEGDSIAVYLSHEKVDSANIMGNAKAMYYPLEGEKSKVSNSYSTGNGMRFVFKDAALDYIWISGAATGLYKYVNLAPRETIDSLAAAVDSTLKYRDFARTSERVQYNADEIEYFAKSENVLLQGHAFLKYQNSSLEAKRIDFNSRLNLLEATGDPVLEEDAQRMYGTDMGYDLDSEAGVIVEGSTKYGEGYYQGKDIYKVGTDVLKVYRSTYTTCDLTHPHYSFHADKMKVYIDDKIVSGPIFLYIGKIPVFFLPFMVNSLHHARSSGFLKPNFDIGIGSREGRFIHGLGYYWATNDYTDFLLTTDFNERKSVRLHLVNNYAVRYVLNGDARIDFVRDFGSEWNDYSKTNEWVFESDHSQTFSPSASFKSHLKFVSSDNAQLSINQSQERTRFIDRRIYSSGSFYKSWGSTRLGLSATREQKLSVALPTEWRLRTTFPTFSLNFPQRSLWFGTKHQKGEQGLWERGLGSILFTPSISATRTSEESIARKHSTVSTGYNMGFSRQAQLGFIGISPSISTGWSYYKVLTYEVDETYDSLYPPTSRPRDRNEVTMNLGTGLSTKVYGTIYPRIGSLVGVRHTITPSVRYAFTPKLTEAQSRSQSVTWSLDNSIDLKLKKGEQEAKSSDVLAWYLSGSYNPELPADRAFSDIGSTTRLRLGSLMSFNLNNRYATYQGRIASTDLSMDLNLGGNIQYPATWEAPQQERIAAAKEKQATGEAPQGQAGSGEPRSGGGWTFGVGYNYTLSGYGASRQRQSNVRYNASAQLSQGWKLMLSANYDIDARNFATQSYSLVRDLHCWQAIFTHERTGTDWIYYFKIEIKVHPDIKYERGTRALDSGFGGSLPTSLY